MAGAPVFGRRLVALLGCLVAFPCLQARAAPAKQPFEVTVTLVLMGTHRKMAHTVTDQRIRKVEFSLNDGGQKTVVDRKLKPSEASGLSSFMATFPLRKLKTDYRSRTRGEGHLVFDIRSGTLKKSIIVYYFKQPDLWQLARRINALLPEEHAVYYGRD